MDHWNNPEFEYSHAVVFVDPDGSEILVFRRCDCGRFINTGSVEVNGVGMVRLTGWKCSRCGPVQPWYEWV
jgi:hypothetical protein